MVHLTKRKHRKTITKLVQSIEKSITSLKPKLVHLFSPLEGLQWLVASPKTHNKNNNNNNNNQSKSSVQSSKVKESSLLTWCSLAYWEERTRVGRLFPVTHPQAMVFSTLPRPSTSNIGDQMCLQALAQSNKKPSESTTRTREKIGLGLILSRDDTGVVLHNRTTVPLFVNSPTLDVPNSRTFSVFKIPPGYSMQVFDFEKSRLYETIRDPGTLDGPFDPYAVRISFAKGWGSKYSRQAVTSCPCWLEVLLVPPR